jgi:DNA (cytosine-5)-methyltransferase 1
MGSVCSGIGGAELAFGGLVDSAFMAETAKFPRRVLETRFPDARLLDDFVKLIENPIPCDILVGGTPCQAWSIAGKRLSLQDARGNLALAYGMLLNTIDDVNEMVGMPPAVCLWENVPGVLNTKDNAFGCFLALLAGHGAPLVNPRGPGRWPRAGLVVGSRRRVAWRILDAQHFGLAQRRKRVFVVASARDGFDPIEVLFKRKGVLGDIAPGRAARKETAGATAVGVGGSKHTDIVNDGSPLSGGHENVEIANTLGAEKDSDWRGDLDNDTYVVYTIPIDMRQTSRGEKLTNNRAFGSGGPPGTGVGNINDPAFTVSERQQAVAYHSLNGIAEYNNNKPTLRAKGGDCGGGSEALISTGQGYRLYGANTDVTEHAKAVDKAATLSGRNNGVGNSGTTLIAYGGNNTSGPINVATACNAAKSPNGRCDFETETFVVQCQGTNVGVETDIVGTLRSGNSHVTGGQPCVTVTAYRTSGNCGAWDTGDRVDALTTTTDPFSHVVTVTGSDHTHALGTANGGKGSSEDGTGRGVPIIAFDTTQITSPGNYSNPSPGDPCHPLAATAHVPTIASPMYVRRLMPVETERLQGFRDFWTDVPDERGKPAADGPRYASIGNAFAVNVVRWIAHRLVAEIIRAENITTPKKVP